MAVSVRKRRYTIVPAGGPVPLCGAVASSPWQAARTLRIDRFPWWTGGARQSAVARMLYDSRSLYVQFRCRDRHISAVETRLNGRVYLDSCVELFLAAGAGYFNVEINCCGTLHVGFGSGRHGRRLIRPDLAAQIGIATSVGGPTKDESPADADWWVAANVPFETLAAFAGRAIRPRRGDVWQGNLYRCGGRTDPQYACWSPVDAPKPDFHRPESFGRLHFG